MKPKIQALLKQIHSGKRLSDKARVMEFVMKHPYCSTVDVQVKLNMVHQTASARVSDLMDMGVIEDVAKKETSTSTFSILKYQSNPDKQDENAKRRKLEKYKNWLANGLNNFNEFINPKLKQQLHESSI